MSIRRNSVMNVHTHNHIYIYIYIYIWQSRVEIEHYSVSYFNRVTVFEPLKRSTSVNNYLFRAYIYFEKFLNAI